MHTSPMSRWSAVVLLGAALLGAGGVLAAWRGAEPPQPSPTSIAVVNVMQVIDSLDEAKELNRQFRERAKSFEQQLKDAKTKEQAMKADWDTLAKDDPTRKDKEMAYILERQSNETKARLLQQLVLAEGGNIRRNLYEKVTAAVQTLAQASNYQLILLDDRNIPLPTDAPDDQVISTILQKKTLYCAESLDITGIVIQRMNNDFAAIRK